MLQEKDQQYIWHPFTQEKTANKNIVIEKAKGVWLYTPEGEKILDGISSWWTNIHGHSNDYINKALSTQVETMEHVIFAGFTHPKAIEISERLINCFDKHYHKVFFSDNGSTSNEVALKMAIQYWYNKGERRNKIIAFQDSYHGDTFGAMSTSGRSAFSDPFDPNLFDVYHVDIPTEENFESVKIKFEEFLKKGDVAAFVFEPLLLGTAGMIIYTPEQLNELIELCDQYNVLTIADEVFTGFYRTGSLFATDQLKKRSDIICLSKGLTGGYMPLGLTVCTQKIYDAFYSNDKMKTFFHGHSYTGNPLSCAVACASLDVTLSQETKDNVTRVNAQHEGFKKELEQHDKISGARIKGTMLAFEINTEEGNSYFNTIRDRLYNYFLGEGVLLRPLGNTLYILPPYVISNEELELIYSAIRKLLKRLDSNDF